MSTKTYRTYRVTHTPLLHSGQRFLPGDLIELADEHAQRGLKGGVIEPWAYTEEPMSGTGPALVMSGTESLPDLPETAYPADAQSIPAEPDAPSPLAGALDGHTPQGLPTGMSEGSERRDQGRGEVEQAPQPASDAESPAPQTKPAPRKGAKA